MIGWPVWGGVFALILATTLVLFVVRLRRTGGRLPGWSGVALGVGIGLALVVVALVVQRA